MMMRSFEREFEAVALIIEEGGDIPHDYDHDINQCHTLEFEKKIKVYRRDKQNENVRRVHTITETPLLHIAIFYRNETALKTLLGKNADLNSECTILEIVCNGPYNNRKGGDRTSFTYTALKLCDELEKIEKLKNPNIKDKEYEEIKDLLEAKLPKKQKDSDNDSKEDDNSKQRVSMKKKDSDSDNDSKLKVPRNKMFKKVDNSHPEEVDMKKPKRMLRKGT